jgi:enoyl-CoA hydratase/carnithine racemase
MPADPPSAPALTATPEGPALVLRIHNPARANALDDGILEAIARHAQDPGPTARVLVLTGGGERHFSAGLDLGDLAGEALLERLRAGERRLGAAVHALATCPVPAVAVVNGAAMGGALELAIGCDWRVATDDARLGMPAARLGVVYAPEGLRRFVAVMGPARARRLFLTGRPIDAAEALRQGLVDEVVPREAVAEVIARVAADVALASPTAVAGTRAAIAALEGRPADEAVAEVERWRALAWASPDLREGLAAYRERRPPRWPA